jgi:hypothetical protein
MAGAKALYLTTVWFDHKVHDGSCSFQGGVSAATAA